jgi:2-methylcitrate dehydratase PrpD
MSTNTVAQFINEIKFENLPSNVIDQAKVAIRDHLGVMLAAKDDRAVTAARNVACQMGGATEATLI